MELKDIKNADALKEQSGIYGTMVSQIADNIQDLKKVVAKEKDIDIYANMLSGLSDAQSKLYQAAKILAEVDEM